jgi:hypothetical protein
MSGLRLSFTGGGITMRLSFAFVLLPALTGCGPMFAPMTPRLAPEDQHTFDQMWDNMLTPVQRVDRQTLLDANVAFWMYTLGVDRLHMTSEKYFKGGAAVMEIDCDRANPDLDQFTITVLDERGRTIRRERYTRADVEECSRMLHGMPNLEPVNLRSHVAVEVGEPTTEPSTPPATPLITNHAETPEEKAFRLESQRRQAAAAAATQPARLGSP